MTRETDDELASILAACDEVLAEGGLPTIAPEGDLSESQMRLVKDLECVRLMRDVWKRPTATMLDLRPACAVPSPPPESLGSFQIIRVIGRGGFGIVYLAFEPRVGRVVALKVPRPDLHLTPELRERFRHEARAAGKLDHPNIVAVFEAGEVDGVAYIATAYCPGVSLAKWLEDRKEPVPVRLAAELVARLADGIAHAHVNNVLHRDLKPANVMLWLPESDGEAPVPKLTDFGLAKSLLDANEGGVTAAGAIIGTPNYLAPEQAEQKRGPLGPGVDVYGLGAILYELLTRRPPFSSDSMLETLRQVRTEDPIAPRRLRSQVPRDLETICLKCLEKNPGRRYAGAAELAADLRCFTAGEPIRARPVSAAERLLRWAQRNPPAAALAAALLLAIAVGVGGIVWQWQRAEREAEQAGRDRDTADGARSTAVLEKERAESNGRRARIAVERMTRAGVDLYRQPGQEEAGRKIIEEALTFHESFVADKSDDPQVVLEAARAWSQAAGYRDQIGQCRAAIDAQRRSIGLYDLRLAQGRDSAIVKERARGVQSLAYLLMRTDQLDAAAATYEDATRAFRDLCAENAGDFLCRTELANTLMNHGVVVEEESPNRAEKLYAEALAIYEDCLAAAPACRIDAALARESLGLVLWRRDRSRRGADLCAAAHAVFRGLANDPSDNNGNWLLSRSDYYLGTIAADDDRPGDAERLFRTALAGLDKLRSRSPDNASYQALRLATLVKRGAAQERAGSAADADATFRQAQADFRSYLARSPEALAQVESHFARLHTAWWKLLVASGRLADAAEFVRRAEAAKPISAGALNGLALAMINIDDTSRRDVPQAVRLARRATELDAKSSEYWITLATTQFRAGDVRAALAALDRAAGVRSAYSPEIGLWRVLIHRRLGESAAADKALAEARAWLDINGTASPEVRRLVAEVK